MPIIWSPRGSLFLKPIGIDIAGRPARFVLTVKTSDRYIAIGSLVFSPNLKAQSGAVGPKIKSTSLNAAANSLDIICLIFFF